MEQHQNNEQIEDQTLKMLPEQSPKFPTIISPQIPAIISSQIINNLEHRKTFNHQDRENWYNHLPNNTSQKQEDLSKGQQGELKNLLDIFNQFDKKQNGIIEIQYIHNILQQINKENKDVDTIIKKNYIVKKGFISFDEFLSILAQIEQKDNQTAQNCEPNPKILEFLNLLDEYREKCENASNYTEANKAFQKIQEVMEKEQIRQKYNIRIQQENELLEMETQQKIQFASFTSSWDKFMDDYEQTAFNTLENLKEKHQLESQEFIKKNKEEQMLKLKYSKHLIELRFKEKMYVKQKQYNEAESIKIKADELEQFERQQKDFEINEKIEFKSMGLKKNQQSIFQALLKRIQTDRIKQLRQRQEDSQRIIIKNRNIRNELIHKHSIEIKKSFDNVKETMCQLLNMPRTQSYDYQKVQQNNLQFNSCTEKETRNKRCIRSESYKPNLNGNQPKKYSVTRDYSNIKTRKLSSRSKQQTFVTQSFKNDKQII